MRNLIVLSMFFAVAGSLRADEPDGRPALRLFQGHNDYVRDVTFTPDGKHLVSASRDGSVRMWDVATGKQVMCFIEKAREFWGVAVSPDGKHVAAGGHSGIFLWETETGKQLRRNDDHWGEIAFLAFTPDNKTLLSQGGNLGGVYFYDVATGKQIRHINANVSTFGLSPDGKQLVTGENRFLEKKQSDARIQLWDVATGKLIRRFDPPKKNSDASRAECAISQVAFSPDGKAVVSVGSYDNKVRLWNAQNGTEIATQVVESNPKCAIFSKDGGKVLVGFGSSSYWILWDVEAQNGIRFAGQKSRADRLALSPDGKYAASASPDRTLGLWQLPK